MKKENRKRFLKKNHQGPLLLTDNLQHVLLTREDDLQRDLKMYIKSFLRYNGELLQYFELMVKQNKDQKNVLNRRGMFFNLSYFCQNAFMFLASSCNKEDVTVAGNYYTRNAEIEHKKGSGIGLFFVKSYRYPID